MKHYYIFNIDIKISWDWGCQYRSIATYR